MYTTTTTVTMCFDVVIINSKLNHSTQYMWRMKLLTLLDAQGPATTEQRAGHCKTCNLLLFTRYRVLYG